MSTTKPNPRQLTLNHIATGKTTKQYQEQDDPNHPIIPDKPFSFFLTCLSNYFSPTHNPDPTTRPHLNTHFIRTQYYHFLNCLINGHDAMYLLNTPPNPSDEPRPYIHAATLSAIEKAREEYREREGAKVDRLMTELQVGEKLAAAFWQEEQERQLREIEGMGEVGKQVSTSANPDCTNTKNFNPPVTY